MLLSREIHQPPQVRSSKVCQSMKHDEAWVHMLSLCDNAYHTAQGLPFFHPTVICHTTLDPCPKCILCDSMLERLERTRHAGIYKAQECRSLYAAAFDFPHAAVACVYWWRCRKSLTIKGLSGSEWLHVTTWGSIWTHFLSTHQDFLDLSVGA